MLKLGFIFAALLLSACQNQPPATNTLRIGLATAPISLDPRFATDAASYRIQELMHCSLVSLGEDFLPRPNLAKTWHQLDPYTWSFTLREDVFFHNGSKVIAHDVAATIYGILDPNVASPLKAGFAAVQSIDVKDNTHLTLHLNQADASLLTRLNIGILPASWAAQPHRAKATMGCGAYKLDDWNNTTLALSAATSQNHIQNIRIQTIKDPVTRVLKLVRGEIDFTQNDLPPHLLPWLKKQNGITITSQPSTTFSYLGLNLEDPILQNQQVRRALALSLDRDLLKKALFGDSPTLGESILTPKHWAATTLPTTSFDSKKAEQLLDLAGFPRDANGIRFSINYRTSTNPTRLRLVTAIADSWQKIGVDVSIESLEWGGFYARIKRGDFQVFSLSWVGITDPDIYRWILHSDMMPPKGSNRGHYSNKQVDVWLDEAATSADITARKKLYANIQQQMHDDVVYIPLWFDAVVAVNGPRLQGFIPRNDGSLLPLLSAHLQ
ncbi:MAG: ABC transporter substrate-binding protein [Zetaproteobacteria bacterium CG2_30_46_52]|nr:MAG: ABC transporter substrate-binding protein [Zetaproteobacteria bacterium CG2_30_46_52]